MKFAFKSDLSLVNSVMPQHRLYCRHVYCALAQTFTNIYLSAHLLLSVQSLVSCVNEFTYFSFPRIYFKENLINPMRRN